MEKLSTSKVLATIGLDEKNQWLLYDGEMRKFLEYIAENLYGDNVLTNEEVMQYETLKDSGELKTGEELSEQLKELEQCFPGIFDVTDKSIEEMQLEIEFLKKDTAEREKRISRMQETQRKQEIAVAQSQKRIDELDYLEKLQIEECTEKSKRLEDLQKCNHKAVVELKELYLQPVSETMESLQNLTFLVLAQLSMPRLSNASGATVS